jgi:DNA primase
LKRLKEKTTMNDYDDIIETTTPKTKTLTNKINIRFQDETLSFNYLAKTCFALAIPYLAIFFLFVIYVLIGASIIHEIEYSSSIYKQASNDNNVNLKELLENFNKNLFSELDILKETQLDNQPDANDIETLKFFTKLLIRVRNNDEKLTSNDIFRKIVKYFILYKQNLINSINEYVQELIENEQKNLINQTLTSIKQSNNDNTTEWSFTASLFYIVSCLTTIGRFIE